MKHDERAKPNEIAAVHIPRAQLVDDQVPQRATQKEWSDRRWRGVPATENGTAPRENEHGADVGDGANYNFAKPCRNGRKPLPPESCGALIIEIALDQYRRPEPRKKRLVRSAR